MIKLLAYDKQKVVYNWKGLNIVGSRVVGSYVFRFPEIDGNKAIRKNVDISYVFKDYEIPYFKENIKSFFEKTAKKDLENELKESLKDSLNQKILIMMVLDDVVVIDK